MYILLPLWLFFLTISAKCIPRQAASGQRAGKLAKLPAGGDNPAGKPAGKLAQLPPGSTTNITNGGSLGGGSVQPGSGASGCPPLMKAVAFNGGMNPGMFDTIGAADDWLTFSCSIPGGPASPHATAGFVPMMAFAKDVQTAIEMVTSDSPPEWMLTFNEPDFSYMGWTPTMSGAEAASAIAPLIEAAKGRPTKFVAPVTADPNSAFHDEFYAACNCKDFFSAYNIHQYNPSSATVISTVQAFHAKWSDKPLWITEVAPGGSGCSTSWEAAGQFMRDIYKFAKESGFVDRVFWNSGNQIDGNDQNVCNSYLVDKAGQPSRLLEMYQAVDCS